MNVSPACLIKKCCDPRCSDTCSTSQRRLLVKQFPIIRPDGCQDHWRCKHDCISCLKLPGRESLLDTVRRRTACQCMCSTHLVYGEKNAVDKIYFYYDTGETVLHIYDGHVESKKFLQNWTREAQAELENFSIVHAKDFFYINNN